MERQLLALVHRQVALFLKHDAMPAAEQQGALAPDAFQRGGHDVRIDPVRLVAFQPEQYGGIGAVPAPGESERAEHFGTHPCHVRQQAGLVQAMGNKARCRPHRADGVRTGRPDADFEQVESTDGHATGFLVKPGILGAPIL